MYDRNENVAGSEVVKERNGEVFTILKAQTQLVDELTMAFKELTFGLEPILMMGAETADEEDRKSIRKPPDSELGRVIDMNNIRVSQMVDGVHTLLRRLRL